MKKWFKLLLLFLIGGFVYTIIELAFRGNSHYSMFILGGVCFILIGGLNNFFTFDIPIVHQMAISSLIITALEFICGCIVNLWLHLNVWDYSKIPFNLMGQVCLIFMVAWFFLSLIGILLDDFVRWKMFGEEKPHYRILG